MVAHRVLALFKIRPDEARMTALVALFFVDINRALAGSTADA